MKCPKCGSNLKEVLVRVHGAKNKAVSHQCRECEYFEFDPSKKVIEELKRT